MVSRICSKFIPPPKFLAVYIHTEYMLHLFYTRQMIIITWAHDGRFWPHDGLSHVLFYAIICPFSLAKNRPVLCYPLTTHKSLA